jgi:hypothetical protein
MTELPTVIDLRAHPEVNAGAALAGNRQQLMIWLGTICLAIWDATFRPSPRGRQNPARRAVARLRRGRGTRTLRSYVGPPGSDSRTT